MQDEWIRLFIFAALHDPTLNQRYLELLHRKVFIPVLLSELRSECDLPPEMPETDIEIIWGFHASFFGRTTLDL